VVALAQDLTSGAATEVGAATSAVAYSVPASVAGNIVIESVSIVPNAAAPSTPIVQAITSVEFNSAGALSQSEYTPYIESYDYTGTYTTGTLSISEVGGLARLTGAGTAWLANATAGDRIAVDMGNGVVWLFRVNTIGSDTQIDTLDFAAAGIAIAGKSYILYKGATLRDSASTYQADVYVQDGSTGQVAILTTTAATSASTFAGRVFFFMSNQGGSLGYTVKFSKRGIQVLQSRR
jgi:hypothetical protein